MKRSYVVIDLKSFYASCECAQRGLHPLKTNLVVADPERGKGTLCLAVSTSLKAQGVKIAAVSTKFPSISLTSWHRHECSSILTTLLKFMTSISTICLKMIFLSTPLTKPF